MGKIVLLDDLTINKIAAGEVIERPASVVKELVENSIDAGADNITVEIKNGGISYIRITDNGKGFMPDDMEIAFERHATSKIREAKDLETVTSMGFRGEALASIAAISHVELVSKTAENEIGKRIELQGGKVINMEDAGCPNGTTITVTDLFYNTPVRYKFLKKDFTEAGYIEDTITRIALVNPNISIKLLNDGKVVVQTFGSGKMQSVVYSVYGKDIAANILNVDYQYEDIKVTGVIGNPDIARSNRTNQQFFVNKRYVRDKVLSRAAEQAYKGLLPIGKYGFLVLNIEMNPKDVDVNVHPAKLEVRFSDENKIFKAVYHSIKDSLQKQEITADQPTEEKHEEPIKWSINSTTYNPTNLFGGVAASSNTKLSDTNTVETKTSDILNNTNSTTDTLNITSTTTQSSNNGKVSLTNEKIDEIINKLKEDRRARGIEGEQTKPAEQAKTEEDTTVSTPETNLTEETPKAEVEKIYDMPKSTVESTINEDDVSQKVSMVDDLVSGLKTKLEDTNNDVIDDVNTKELEQKKLQSISSYEQIVGTIQTPKKETIKNNYTELEEKEEDKIESRFGALFNKFGHRKQEKQEETAIFDNIDDTKNFIAQIYNSKNSNETESTQNIDTMVTKVIDSTKINKKLNEIEEQQKAGQDDSDFEKMYEKTFGTKIREDSKLREEESKYTIGAKDLKTAENVSLFNKEENYIPEYKFIGIAFEEYIVLEIKDELYIVDQRAAQERIIYESIKENYYNEENKDSQLMLLPDIINLNYKDMQIAKDNMDIFKKAGFELEEFGENTIKLTGVPTVCIDLDTKALFIDTLDEINTVARTSKQEVEEKFIATIANKAATKAHMARTKDEVDNLMRQLLALQNPFTSPQKGPTAIRMTKGDIEKKFSRR